MKESYSNTNTSMKGKSTSGNINSNKGNSLEIDKKVEEFRNRLKNDVNELVQKEKMNEDKRTKNYENEKDPAKKQKIESENKKQREEAQKKIANMQNDVERQAKKYREKLENEAC